MTNSLVTFNFNSNQVRTQLINNEPWFCLSDCCKALNIKNQQTSVKLPENGVGKTYLIDSMGREQQATIINEPNLYRLIFRSNKPQAQAFADWVYSEVLPSIRKTGSYGVPAPIDMRAIGGVVKKCATVAVRDELKEVIGKEVKEVIRDQFLAFVTRTFAAALDLQPFQRVTDDMLLRGLYDWYSTKHHEHIKAIENLTAENDCLKSKMATIRKTAAE